MVSKCVKNQSLKWASVNWLLDSGISGSPRRQRQCSISPSILAVSPSERTLEVHLPLLCSGLRELGHPGAPTGTVSGLSQR